MPLAVRVREDLERFFGAAVFFLVMRVGFLTEGYRGG
jgi:hypothetical protein